jgi:hypothetical protein
MATAAMKPSGETETPGIRNAATSRPIAEEPRKIAQRRRKRITR